jgi:phage/plasmid primase, P4 family, C-terminal domain
MEALKILLCENVVNTGEYNFLSLYPIPTKYNLPKHEFWNIYDKAYLETEALPSLLEIPSKDFSVLRFDIDIYPLNGIKVERLYTDKLVRAILTHIHFLITDSSGKECDESIKNPSNFISCVFEKKKWTKKDGIHIVFPELFIKNDFQESYFVPKLQVYLDKEDNKFVRTSVDKVTKKPWILLGSTKDCNSDCSYRLTRVYDKSLSMLNLDKYKPSSFSINNEALNVYGKHFARPIYKKTRLPSDVDKDYHTIMEWDLLRKLSTRRAEDYDLWIEIGIILYNVGCGTERFLNLWKDFSKLCPDKYNERICETKWNTFTSRNISIRSLFYYFKQDNHQLFEKMIDHQNANNLYQELFPGGQAKELLKQGCILENYHIAKIFYSRYCNDIVWAPLKGKSGNWYKFDGHKWIQICDEILWGKINAELCVYINDLFEQIHLDRSVEDDDEKTVKYLRTNQNNITKKLHNTNFVKRTLEASKSFFINQDFHTHLDANKFLMGCSNGLLDLDRSVFRPSSPDDFVSLSTGIEYREPTDDDKNELHEYLKELFIDEELIQNFIEIMASLLVGSNDDKNIIIALGPTNAGKTQLVKLFEKTLGDYSITFPKELVYQRSISSASARPELARVEGKRIAFVNELSKDERMNVATMKELSGNDKFYARRLYMEGNEIIPMFTMYLSCNEVPRIPQDDEAFWGRLLIIDFKSTFTNNSPCSRTDQLGERRFPRISNLEEKFSRLAPILLWTLFNTFVENKLRYSKGIPKCTAIRDATKHFREDNNPVNKFVLERITIDDKDGEFIKCTDLFVFYSNWYKSYFPDQKIRINRDQFKHEFSKLSHSPLVKMKPHEYSRKVEGWDHIVYAEKNDDT